MGDYKTIRSSGLPQWPDCPKRSVARAYPRLLADAGYELRHTGASIGAAIGTATHKGNEFCFQSQMRGETYTKETLTDLCRASIEREIADGVVWDHTTTNLDVAVFQAVRQTMSVMQTLGDKVIPVALECHYRADVGDGFILSGHIDILEADALDDWKTGAAQRGNIAQYGGYSILARTNGHPVSRLTEVFIPRVGPTKPQPDPIITPYPLEDAEWAAWGTIAAIKRDLTEFVSTGNPHVFLPNPSSMMCSKNYCPAHGTRWCRAHKPSKES